MAKQKLMIAVTVATVGSLGATGCGASTSNSVDPQAAASESATPTDINPVPGYSQSAEGEIVLDLNEVNTCADIPWGRLCASVDPQGYRAAFYRPTGRSRIYVDFNLICDNHSAIGDQGAFWTEPGQNRSYVFQTGHGVRPCAVRLYLEPGRQEYHQTGKVQPR